MKRLVSFVTVLFAFAAVAICQPTDTQLPDSALSLIAAFVDKHVWVAYVVIAWGVISEILGSIPSIKANTTYQLVFGWIGWVINLFKPKAK